MFGEKRRGKLESMKTKLGVFKEAEVKVNQAKCHQNDMMGALKQSIEIFNDSNHQLF